MKYGKWRITLTHSLKSSLSLWLYYALPNLEYNQKWEHGPHWMWCWFSRIMGPCYSNTDWWASDSKWSRWTIRVAMKGPSQLQKIILQPERVENFWPCFLFLVSQQWWGHLLQLNCKSQFLNFNIIRKINNDPVLGHRHTYCVSLAMTTQLLSACGEWKYVRL